MHKLSLCIFSFLSILLFLSANAQQSAPTLAELIDSAVKKDYSLDNQKLDINLTALDRQRLSDAYLPRVKVDGMDGFALTSVSLKTKEIRIPQLNIDIQEGRNRYTSTSNVAAVNTEASMLLYSGGKIPWLKKSLDQKIKGQTQLTEQQKQDIISDVVSTYDQLALLKQTRRVLDESEKRLAEHMKIADKAFSYGLITKYERQKIEVAQAQLASKIEDYEGKLGVVREHLYWLTNIPVERLTQIENELLLIENVMNQNTVSNRSDLKALDAFIAAQDYKIKAEKTWFVPKIQTAASLKYMGIFWGHLQSSKAVLNGNKISSDLPAVHVSPMASIGIGFSWDLFDGKEGKHNVEKAILELHITENDKKDLSEKLELNLTKTRADYQVTLSQVTVMQRQQQTASNALDQATKEYRTGLIRTSQLIDAEEDFQNAALGLIQSMYNQRRTAIELLKATGSLTPESLKQEP
jgi:outer membrane protein TolC